MKSMRVRACLLAVGVLSVLTLYARSATYYVDGSRPDDSGDGTTRSTARKYIRSGIGLMAGGDTLLIADGVYTGDSNMISNPGGEWTGVPSGTADRYTVIKSEHPLGAVIDGELVRIPIWISGNSYVRFEDLHARNALNSNFMIFHSDHVKVLRCAASEAYYHHFWFRYSTYCLVEDCFTWGRGAYSFVFGGTYGDYTTSQYNIARRCVSRRDAHYFAPGGNHWASFVTYWADNTYFQNCLSIDGHYIYVGTTNPPYFTKSVFYTANGSSSYSAEGCISLNDEGQIGQFESAASPVTLRNNSCILSPSGGSAGVLTYGNAVTIENNILAGANGTSDWSGAIGEAQGLLLGAKHNILHDNRFGFVAVDGAHSYNVLHDNTGGDYRYSTTGSNEVTDVNPLTNGLMYPTRIEAGSYLAGAGEGGGRVGPEILKKLGVSGALYGEVGWNAWTADDLWPWPNEDTIRTKMRSYNLHGADGARGFCADGQTLTKYVWEYLGHPIPPEIYGGTGSPVIFFTDLTSGPNTGGKDGNGAFVSIFGRNFGTARGTSCVTVGGGEVSDYLVWGVTNAANPELDRIVVQLGSNAQTGEIVVHTARGNSNGKPFVVRPGRILFVDDDAPAGGDGSFAMPWQTHVDFYNNEQAGDICYFREGVYSGVNRWGIHYNVDSGGPGKEGTPSNEIAWVGYPGETAVFEALTPGVDEGNFAVGNYHVVANFRLKSCYRGAFATFGGIGYRFINNDCSGTSNFTYSLVGPSIGPGAVYGNNLHDLKSGNKLSHPIYIGYGASDVDVGWNTLHDNDVDWGPIISIHRDYAILGNRISNATGRAAFKLVDSTANFVDSSENHHVGSTVHIVSNGREARITAIDSTTQLSLDSDIFTNGDEQYVINQYVFRRNSIHDNNIDCSYRRSRGIGQVNTGRGSSVSIYNNKFINCGGFLDWYLPFYFYSGSADVYNNTIYQIADSAQYVFQITAGGAYMPERINIKNNIVVSDADAAYFSIANEQRMQSLVIDGNLYAGHGPGPVRDVHAVNADPLFADVTTLNLRLQSNSPAIDAGLDVRAVVTADFDGIPRPQGLRIDIGAYESLVPDADADGLPDGWETSYFGGATGANAAEDYDLDGFSTFQEYLAGTDPTDGHSRLGMTSSERVGSPGFVVRWSSASNRAYAILRSTNLLMNGAVFTQLGTDIPATPPENVYTDATAGVDGRFYRVGVVTP
ncbi:MAG: choice-of-anchor Q domain-containing protein [bacterium]